MNRLYSQEAPPWTLISSASLVQLQPALATVGRPDEVSVETDTLSVMEATVRDASKLPWCLMRRKRFLYLYLQSPCRDRPAPSNRKLRPLPGWRETDEVGRVKSVT